MNSTSGQVLICQKNVEKHLKFCQQNIGYCPQTNPLFSKLTVRQHLLFYAKIKNYNSEKSKNFLNVEFEINRLTQSLGLEDKLNAVG